MTLPGKDLKVLRQKYYVTVRNSEMIDYNAIKISKGLVSIMTEYRIVIFLDNDKHIWIEFIQDPDSEFPISLETTALIELLDVDNGIDTLHIPDRKRDH